jgi:hypothetical protein
VYSQTITFATVGVQNMSGIPVQVDHYVTTANGTTFVRVFRTHYGNGNTSQYAQYPSTRSEMDRLFNTSYAATNWWWQGNVNATTSLNFTNYNTLTNAGVSVPSNGNYYSTEVTFTFVAAETGTYSFRLTSDDGSDLTINGFSVIEYYGGKGIGSYKYGTYSMVQGSQYTVVARMQEYGGGDGMILQWKRPSASNYYLLLSEVGFASSSWVSQGTQTTTSTGVVTFSNPNSYQYRVTVDVSNIANTFTESEMNYLMYLRMFPNQIASWDYHTMNFFEADSSNTVTYSDVFSAYTIYKWGQLFNYTYNDNYIYSQSEKDDIEINANSLTYHLKYPKSAVRTFNNLNRFYIVSLGKHRQTTTTQKMTQ